MKRYLGLGQRKEKTVTMNSLKEKLSFWLSSALPQPGRNEKFLFNTPQLHFTEREEDTSVLQQEVERGCGLSLNTSTEAWKAGAGLSEPHRHRHAPLMVEGREGERRALWLQWLQCPQPWSGHWSLSLVSWKDVSSNGSRALRTHPDLRTQISETTQRDQTPSWTFL